LRVDFSHSIGVGVAVAIAKTPTTAGFW